MPTVADTNKRELNRALLRQAGEHLGTLSEHEHEKLTWETQPRRRREAAEKYAAYATLSRRLLEIANG